MSRAVVLVSGGLDSATTAAVAKAEGHEIYAISFDYGQRHSRELDSAKAIADAVGAVDHLILTLDLRKIGKSALTDDIDVPVNRKTDDIASGIPATYVPARNAIFLSLAMAYAESLHARDIFIGVSQVDYSGYPDCRSEFIEAFQNLANLATKLATEGGEQFRIRAPLINMSKARIIKLGTELGVDYSRTWSCYQGGETACGKCDSCKLRLQGFEQAGITDPLEYADDRLSC